MLKVQNLYKRYRFKSGCTINLEFGSKGFVVLFGSNESGNKALLNIIGGLEKFDSGDLLVNNTSIKSLTNETLNYYRNNYIGYILEDIGLFSHLSVSENLALALEIRCLNKEEILQTVNEIITRFNLQDIKDCKPNQLRVQEKQRVKIAGAIAKDPKIILVDGKIDNEILKMIKELSQEKLVIMATDDDNVKQFCDRIIEFYGREIISDEIINEHNLGVIEFEDSLNLKNMSLYLKSMFNFTRKWICRKYIMTLFFIITILLFGLATNYGRYNVGYVSGKTMYDNNITELVFQNGGYRYVPLDFKYRHLGGYKDPVKDVVSDIDLYKETFTNNKYYEVRSKLRPRIHNVIYHRSSVQGLGTNYRRFVIYDDIKQFESSIIYGDKIKESTDVYITDYLANMLVKRSEESIQMDHLIGEEITVNLNVDQMYDLYWSGNPYGLSFTIVGILDTDYEQYENLKNSEDFDIVESGYLFDIENKYGKIITSSENMQIIDNLVLEDSGIELINYYLNDMDTSDVDYHFSDDIYVTTYFKNNNVVLLGNSKMPTNDKEVVIPIEYIRNIMNSKGVFTLTLEELKDEQDKYLNEFINKKFRLKYNLYSGTYEKELTIVGFYTRSDWSIHHTNGALVVSDELYKEIYYNNLVIDMGVELGDDEKENIALFQSLDENYWHNTLYSDAIYDFESKTNNTEEVLYKIAFALILIPVVMGIITTSSQAEDRKKQVRTLQSKGINPIRFFMMRGLMAWLITSIIGYLLLSVIMIVINLIVTNMYNISYFLPYQSIFSILTVIVVSLIIYIGAALKEIYHIKRMN